MPSSAVFLTPTECVCVWEGGPYWTVVFLPFLTQLTPEPHSLQDLRRADLLPENPSLVQDVGSVAYIICLRLLMSALDIIKSPL